MDLSSIFVRQSINKEVVLTVERARHVYCCKAKTKKSNR